RALDVTEKLLRSVREGLSDFDARHAERPFSDWPVSDQQSTQALGRLANHLATEVYFASGAHDAGDVGEGARARFYREAGLILDALADMPFPGVVHHLLQTLEASIPFDPPGVLLRIGHALREGQRGGYQYESLGADLFVKLVERYLAEYPELFRVDEA